jgi:hypothetical protein
MIRGWPRTGIDHDAGTLAFRGGDRKSLPAVAPTSESRGGFKASQVDAWVQAGRAAATCHAEVRDSGRRRKPDRAKPGKAAEEVNSL